MGAEDRVSRGNVTSLRGDCIPSFGEPSQEIIDLLKEALAQAEAGQLVAIGLTRVLEDGSSVLPIESDLHWTFGQFRNLYIGIHRLAHNLERKAHEE